MLIFASSVIIIYLVIHKENKLVDEVINFRYLGLPNKTDFIRNMEKYDNTKRSLYYIDSI